MIRVKYERGFFLLHQDLPGKISGIRGPVVAACCIQEKGDGTRAVLFTLCCSVLQCVAVCCSVLQCV